MDDHEFTGSASEFLALRNEPQPDDGPSPSLSDTDDDTPAAIADATEPSFADDDDLSPEERVAAVLAEDAAESGETPEPLVAEPDAEAEEADDTPDLDRLTPEQLRALAEEALELRAKQAETSVDAEQRQLEAEVYDLDARTAQAVNDQWRAAYQQQVVEVSNVHYGALLDRKLDELREYADTQRDPEAYYAANRPRVRQQILNAQRVWEEKQAAVWQPRIEAALAQAQDAARKQHPGLRKLFAEMLVEERGLPKKAAAELLKIKNTDDMPEAADMLRASVAAHRQQKAQASQQLREQAARATPPLPTPPTGTPVPRKPVALKGTEREWLALRRQLTG